MSCSECELADALMVVIKGLKERLRLPANLDTGKQQPRLIYYIRDYRLGVCILDQETNACYLSGTNTTRAKRFMKADNNVWFVRDEAVSQYVALIHKTFVPLSNLLQEELTEAVTADIVAKEITVVSDWKNGVKKY